MDTPPDFILGVGRKVPAKQIIYLLLGQNLSIERNFLNDAHGLLRTKSKKKTLKYYILLLN